MLYKKIIEKFKSEIDEIEGSTYAFLKKERKVIPYPRVLSPDEYLARCGFPDEVIKDIKAGKIRKDAENIQKAKKFVDRVLANFNPDMSDVASYISSLIKHSKKLDTRLLVIGEAGVGKTTAIAYICYKLYAVNPFITTAYITLYNIQDWDLKDMVSSSITVFDNLDVFKYSQSNSLYDNLSFDDKRKITSTILQMYDRGRAVILTVNDNSIENAKEVLRRIGNESLAQRFESVINLSKSEPFRLEKRRREKQVENR